ncbi:MAG: 16S rRNA (guanine(966)-N(2))-methyltransferase RsmD [Candidatus Omnitrophica bacterium]|nr:16S rRNA (guanine(966)-N(2))-methyltransferase RsmD [Candidatus Omnitrophota bacterium]
MKGSRGRHNSNMRIIGGQFRGRKLERPLTDDVRPTKDRIREAVFNIIAEKIPGSYVLDLYAGSGAFGLEAASRGAESIFSVDNDPKSVNVIRKNVELLKVENAVKIFQEDAQIFVEKACKISNKFDIIFLDPPYNRELAKKTLITICKYDILNALGIIVVEHHALEALPEKINDVNLLKQKTYKETVISIYIKK